MYHNYYKESRLRLLKNKSALLLFYDIINFIMGILILQRLLVESLIDIFYFPLWWYSKGALYALRRCFNLLKSGNENLAPGLWLANIFVPMYGQFDFQGRLISFFMRLAQIIGRLCGLMIWLVFCSILFLIWLALPIFVFWGLIYAI